MTTDSGIPSNFCNKPKYRCPSSIDFTKCREESAAALYNTFLIDGVSESLLSLMFKYLDIKHFSSVSFYITTLPYFTLRNSKEIDTEFDRKFVLAHAC